MSAVPTVLAISPHLDDAVFSAGGTLARLAHEGWRAVVATVFTASVRDPAGFALACQLDKGLAPGIDYMALRREEDAAACAVLGATPIWLPFHEAPHRGYETAPALFAGLREADGIVDEIAPALATLVDEVAPDLILAPQCIGAHVDHIAVHLALRAGRLRPHWWVDFPYVVRSGGQPSPFSSDFADHAAKTLALQPGELDAKLDAAACYASQLGFQFGGAAAAREAIASSGAIERFAIPAPPPAGRFSDAREKW